MVIGASFQHSPRKRAPQALDCAAFWRLTVVFISAGRISAAQQSATCRRATARPASKAASPFLEAETCCARDRLPKQTEDRGTAQAESLQRGGLQPAGNRLQQREGLRQRSGSISARAEARSQFHSRLITISATSTSLRKNSIWRRKSSEKSCVSIPRNREANYNLGLVLMARRLPAEAIPHFQRVRPADLPTRFNLVRAYLQAGRTAEGLKLARELSAQNKDDVQLHFTLGVLLAAAKQYPAGPTRTGKGQRACSRKHSKFSSTWDRLICSSGEYAESRSGFEPGAETETRFG